MKTTRFFPLSFNQNVHLTGLVALLLISFSQNGSAQVLHNNINNIYTQNFNTLPSNGSTLSVVSNTTLTGWYVADKNGNTTVNAVSGAGSSGAVNLYNFGTGGSADRALGSVGTNSNEYAWGLRMKNNTGQNVQSVSVSFVGEQWRRSDDPEEHLVSFSYKVSAQAITTFNTSESGFSKSPFLNFISPQFSGGASAAIDGNLAANRYTVTLRFNVSIPNGSEIMFKWFDRNDPDVDHGLAIDDVSVRFYTSTSATDQFTGQTPLTHFMKGFIYDIPDEGSGAVFNEPTLAQLNSWGSAVTQVMNAQYSSARTTLASNNIGYRITSFAQAAQGNLPARTYYLLAKDGLGANHWGTYVFSPSAGKPCLSFQAPHPLHDDNTGEQATYLYRQLDAYHLAISGANRCLDSTIIACTGSSGPCRADGQNVVSDPAHNTESVFQKTTEVIAAARPTERFLQMHGFGSMTDTMLVISNGTRQTPVNDRAVQLGNALLAAKPTWKYTTPHQQLSLNKYTGLTNVQGRLLNAYPNGDICTTGITSTNVTGRFLHLEQAPEVRLNTNFATMKTALAANGICDCAAPMNISPGGAADIRTALPPEQTETTGLLQVRYGGGAWTAYLRTSHPDARLAVTNMVGQSLWENTVAAAGEASVPLPAEKWAPGVYVLTAVAGGEKWVVKFVVE